MKMGSRSGILAMLMALGLSAFAQATDPAARKAVLDALKAPVEKELTIPVTLRAEHLKADAHAAFVMATVLKSNGRKMDFKGTPFDQQANVGGSFTDSVVALLKKESGAWRVKAITVGATDAPDGCWHKEFKVSKSLFPSALILDDCPSRVPFVFAENRTVRLNGGIGLSLPELQTELVDALLRMDKLPQKIDVDFADGTSRQRQADVQAVAQAALVTARQTPRPSAKP